MASVSNEQFLFSCINHSNNGTIDFNKVAEECNIVSRGAAAIKYKRMKDKFGTASAAANTQTANDDEEDGASEETSKPKKKAHAKKTASKKRKLNEDNEEEAKVKAEEDD